jgi:PST family polysaccharide transporter
MTASSLEDDPSGKDNPSPDDPFAVAMDVEGLKRRSVHGSFATILSQGVKMVIQIGSQVILARLLFPTEFGLLAMAYPVIAFVQVFNDIGLGQAIVQRPTLVGEQISTLFWVNIAISFALACLVAVLAPVAGRIYGEPRLVLLTIVLGMVLPVTAAAISPAALLVRHMRFGLMARNEVVAMLAGTTVTILCALGGLSYWSMVAGQFTNAIVGNILVWSACAWRPTRPKFNASVWNDVKFGGNITLSNLATFMTTSGDNMIVGLTAGKIALGLYDRSYNLVVQPIGQMMAPLSRVAVPLLSRLAGQANEYRSAYLQMFRMATLLIVPAMLVCISSGTTLINLLLGPRWSAAAPIFSWICVGGLSSGIYSSAAWLFISQDRSRELKLFTAMAAVINVTSFLIGSIWGVVGIAMAASIGFVFLTTPLMLLGATRRGPVRPNDIVPCSVSFIIEGLVVYAILMVGISKCSFQGFPKLIVVTLVSYGLFVGLSLASKANRQLLRNGFHSLRGLLPQ